ncbi:hypothetical protein ACO1O0_001475 [Amphichorda felina]
MAGLESTLTPALLSEIRDFWFSHIDSEDALILPDQEHIMRWFVGGEELDKLCVQVSPRPTPLFARINVLTSQIRQRFAPTLTAIRASGATTGREILEAANPQGPLDWLSLVVLLDQLPRNCYRGDEASVAFTVFDPLARDVAAAAIERGIPETDPQIQWLICRRMWFYLPLMHSEDLAMHEQATEAYARLAADMESLASGSQEGAKDGVDEVRARAVRVMAGHGERAIGMAKMQIEFEKKHLDIIRQFGRYPHRNKALGREPTAEEIEYLANGGETFSASQNKN